jgi:lysozyme
MLNPRMEVSGAGLIFIKSFEGEILHVYDDGYGFPTGGVGHLIKPEDHMKLGDKVSPELSMSWFKKDIASYVKIVNDFVSQPITQNQFDALVSLSFNIGVGNFKKSSVLVFTNKKNFKGAAEKFGLWIHSNGKLSKGLVRRRAAEARLFLTP